MDKKEFSFNTIIRHFSPAWYASVMGTGGVANVLYALSANMGFLKPLAIGMWWLNILLFLLLIVPWTARWFMHFDKLKEDLAHPVMSNFFVTMPVGGIVLATNFFMIGKGYFSMTFITSLGMIFWIFGVLMALIFGIYVTYNIMAMESIGPELTNFSWFITPVASIIIPLLGNMLVNVYINTNRDLAALINIIDICFFGIGFLLFIILSSILMGRFINHKMPHAMATPTFWILLGPIGVGTISLMGLADASKLLNLITAAETIKFFALIFWGLGLWAFLLAVVITIKYIRDGGIPFSLSWWAFIFPVAAYVLSALNVYQLTKVKLIQGYALLLALLLLILWIITFIRSLIGTFNTKLLIPQQQNK